MRFVYKVGVVALLASFFIMSHNAGAVSRTIYLKNGVYSYGIPVNSGSQGGGTTYVTSSDSYNYNVNAYSLAADRMFYSMAFRLKSDNTNIDLSPYTDFTFTFSYCSDTQYFAPSSNDVFRVTDYYEYQASNTEHTLYSGQTSDYTFQTDHCRNVMLRGKVGISSYNIFQLGTTNNSSFTRIFGYNFGNLNGAPPLLIISPTVVFYDEPNEADEAIQKEKENVQNAADNSETQAEGNSTSTQTTNLIGAFQSFVTALTSLNATNCNVTLAWPSSLGGNMQVNICQNKDYAGNIISVFGSLTLIVFYIPFSLKILSMIYNEIRSFTNG